MKANRSVYIDTSCLLKLVVNEPESPSIERIIDTESDVVISSLANLEARVHLSGLVKGGSISKPLARRLAARLDRLAAMLPFRLEALEGRVFEEAAHQLSANRAHCRTLDRLHLAAMTQLSVSQLLTNDIQQAVAARGLGFAVMTPAPFERGQESP